jgi:diaminohydroxyphosphoribosylaminopyrimidine deaminase / 5-amino-6-(5-phosphoribosylamino)uracil reductase
MDRLTPEMWRGLLHRSPASADVSLFGPLLAPETEPDGTFVLGRLAQSLDGFIATRHGESHWISGPEDIAHTHRLRALFDAVVVGARTVRADNPQLTTRLVEGPSPVRVVLDPDRRLDADYRVFGTGPQTLLLCAPDAPGGSRLGAAEVLPVTRGPSGLDIRAVLAALAERGLRRVFVEGGGVTVSRFLEAGVLDRLHITIAPLLIGDGIPAFPLPPAQALADGRRFAWFVHPLGRDVLLDIALDRQAAQK